MKRFLKSGTSCRIFLNIFFYLYLSAFAPQEAAKQGSSKYIPPSMRDGGGKRVDTTNMARKDDATAIRISNLSESTTDPDLEELVRPFGPVSKIYLAKDKQTGQCKGFAYIHFKFKSDASKAITALNGHGYDHLILSVDWSKSPGHN